MKMKLEAMRFKNLLEKNEHKKAKVLNKNVFGTISHSE